MKTPWIGTAKAAMANSDSQGVRIGPRAVGIRTMTRAT